MDEQRDLLKKVEFGIEVEAFLNGPIGKYLLQQSERDVAEATEQLKTVNPTDFGKIVELQSIIRRWEDTEGWLAGIIQEGWHAERQLKGEDSL